MTPSCTSFFQIITNSAFQEGKLKFPNKYVHEHGNELNAKARLSLPTGCRWDVRVKREDDGTIWLHDGFLEFMKDNSIGIEYFLMFKHEGNSKFVVHIFDLTATEIMYNYSSDSERCNVVNEIEIDEIREGGDDSSNYESNYKDSVDGEYDSFKESGDKDSDDHVDDSLKNESVCEISDDDIDDPSKYESFDEDVDDEDDSFINENADKGYDNGSVDSRKYESGGKDTDGGSIEFLGSTMDHPLPQVFAEPSEFLSKHKESAGVPRETTRAGRCYLTRKKSQIIEGCFYSTGSMPKTSTSRVVMANQSRNDGTNISPRDISKDITTRAKRIEPTVPNSFRVSIRPYHITKGILRVPSAFARSHMCYSTTLIKLVDADSKEWEVSYLHRNFYFFLSKGWLRFVQDKLLMVADICVFERIGSKEEVKLKVNIIRSS